MSSSRGFNPDVCLNLVEQYRVTDLVFAGDAGKTYSSVSGFCIERDDLMIEELNHIVSSGVTWSPKVKRFVVELL